MVVLPLLIWLGYQEVQNNIEKPEAVIVLGGSTKNLEREKFTAKFASQYPNLPILISGGSPPVFTKRVFNKAGINPQRLHLDYEAVDTVTNFTTLVDDLQARKIKNVYLITSDFHMRRACVIAEIILGSRGIKFKAIPVPSQTPPEPIEKSIRDGVRSLVWVATGYTGAEEVKHRR
ncbi:YdcF family protein [Anabaena sp. CCY 9402-a]|uniref:YdcF family protein n=1 Tax=Anabaena sp. CCY 9402-a TaxID=3103867 RepID=UPI0039C73D79